MAKFRALGERSSAWTSARRLVEAEDDCGRAFALGSAILLIEKMVGQSVKPVVKTSTMDQELQDEVIHVAQVAMDTETNEQQIAHTIKTHFEQKYHGLLWHCCVGRNVACYVTHEQSKFLYFYVGQMAVVLFATA